MPEDSSPQLDLSSANIESDSTKDFSLPSVGKAVRQVTDSYIVMAVRQSTDNSNNNLQSRSIHFNSKGFVPQNPRVIAQNLRFWAQNGYGCNNSLRYYSSTNISDFEGRKLSEEVERSPLVATDRVQTTYLGAIHEINLDDNEKIKELRYGIMFKFQEFMNRLGKDQPVRYWFTVHSPDGVKALGKASVLYPQTVISPTMTNHIITEFMRVQDQYGGKDTTYSRREFEMIVINVNWKRYVDDDQLAKIKDKGLLEEFKKAIVLETNSNLQKIAGSGRHFLNPKGLVQDGLLTFWRS